MSERYEVAAIRAQFPILDQQVHGKPLVYLDNAASAQKPERVIEAIAGYYRHDHANVHRGVHALSQRATTRFEHARSAVRDFLNAASDDEIVFTKGCTDGINLVAHAYRSALRPGDEVLITAMEHHSMIVPWQIACEISGATLKVVPIDDRGQLDLDALDRLLTERTKVVGCVHVSNALGTINPVGEIVRKAHAVGAKVLVDGAQATPHQAVDVRALDVDFYAFSGHKVYGPTGIGALYGKRELLGALAPYQGGGDMIETVSFARTTYAAPPNRFEAGTPNIADAIGLHAAIDFVTETGLDRIAAHEHRLLERATAGVLEIPGLRIVGTAEEKAGVVSFVVEGAHAQDIGTLLDMEGVATRVGHHCTMPLMARLGVSSTCRASFAAYNTEDEVDAFVAALHKALRMLR